MLRSFNKHFNETVFRGPDTEGGSDVELDTDTGDVDAGDTGGADPDDGDSGEADTPKEPLTVREQLKKAIAETSEPSEKPKSTKKASRIGDRTPKAAAPDPAAAPEAAQGTVPAPESLSKEAKAAWDAAPQAIKDAFIKREQDTARGVEELKQRYANIDKAIAPHQDALRQMNATPGEAVDRMFLWFKALANSPAESFPALAKSLGLDWSQLIGLQQQVQGQQPPAGQQPDPNAQPGAVPPTQEELSPAVRQYIEQMQQQLAQVQGYVQQVGGRFQTMEEQVQQQNMQRTEENLKLWSNGKPYFDEVRLEMAQLLQSGLIPLKDGQVDLDTAYERAIYFNPEVRAKVLAEQQQANTQVQQETAAAATTAQQAQVSRARKASVSLPSSNPPGTPSAAVKKKPGQKLSVRESLKAAMAELRDQ